MSRKDFISHLNIIMLLFTKQYIYRSFRDFLGFWISEFILVCKCRSLWEDNTNTVKKWSFLFKLLKRAKLVAIASVDSGQSNFGQYGLPYIHWKTKLELYYSLYYLYFWRGIGHPQFNPDGNYNLRIRINPSNWFTRCKGL